MEWPITKQEWIRLRKEDERLRNIVSQHYQQSENCDDIMKEKDLLENLLLSTQQENERCEAELKIWKAYAKELEKKIESYEGPHWQEHPGVPSTPVPVKVGKTGMSKQPVRSVRMIPMAREEKGNLSAINSEGSFTATPQFKSTTQANLGKSLTHSDLKDERMEYSTNKAKRRSATFWEHEEQIVPALANAEKKQERRLSLQMLSEASVRRPVNDISVVLDKGDRYMGTDSAIGKSESAIETLQVAGYNLIPESAFQHETSSGRNLDGPADRLESIITAFETQIAAMLTRHGDSIDRIHASETAQQNARLESLTTRLAEMSIIASDRSTAAQQSFSSMTRAIQDSEDEWREEANCREERLQTMLEEANAQAALLLADIPAV